MSDFCFEVIHQGALYSIAPCSGLGAPAAAAPAGASSSSMDYSYLNQSTFDAAASALTGAMDGGRDISI